MRLGEIGREKARRCDTYAISLSQFLPLYYEDKLVGLMEMGSHQLLQALLEGLAISL